MSQRIGPLNILVVGAGLGGLATALALQTDGHNVTAIDSAAAFGEVGAGIHLPPNSSRLLLRWGVDLGPKQSTSSRYHFIRYADGSTIASVPFGEVMQEHGAPYYLVHRADLHIALLEAAKRAGVTVLANQRVVSYDFDAPTATTADGTVYKADLIIAADGIKSTTRALLSGQSDRPRDTGDVAYRILLPGSKIRADPLLAPLITGESCISSWCGPEAHFIGYPIRNGELYNVVICATSHNETTEDSWVVKGDNTELRQRFANWEPRVQRLCSLVDDFMKWRLCDVPDVTRWVHPSGKACLLGDSCHPMLPYLAQGAAMAFEDAAVLRQCLATGTNLKSALQRYQEIRMPRARLVQAKTREHQYVWHIEDGEQQAVRDVQMKRNTEENPVFWGFDDRRSWLFSHDAEVLGTEGANWTEMANTRPLVVN